MELKFDGVTPMALSKLIERIMLNFPDVGSRVPNPFKGG
jgi:hypothetical protein